MKIQDIQEVETTMVACDGGVGSLGHPLVYLSIAPHLYEIECPYCSKKFILKNSSSHSVENQHKDDSKTLSH